MGRSTRSSRRSLLALMGVALGGAVAAPGCGYTLVGSGRGVLPEGIDSVYVATFVNETTKVGLEQRITDAVLRELSARARLKPVSSREGADAELTGRLSGFQVDAVRFDDQGRALEYQITLTASVKLYDRKAEKVILENPAFLYREPYLPAGLSGSSAQFADVENAAVERLAQPFSRSLVTTILEGF